LELGITTFAETLTDGGGTQVISHGDRIRQVLEEVELADKVGLDIYAIGEHHRPDFAASAPAVILAAAAARTKRIRLSPAVTVLSSDDPVRVFQQFATLDLISSGRAELLVGRGSFIESFPLFGYSLNDYEELFSEKLDLLLAIRDNERVTWSGKFRAPLEDQGIYPRPEQSPFPIWVGVGGTPESAIRAGHRGLPVALAIIGGSPDRFSIFSKLHRRSLAEAGFSAAEIPLGVHAHGHIADSSDQAADEFYPSYATAMTRIGRERGWGPMTRAQFEQMRTPEGSLVLGTPAEVAEKILRWRDILDVNRFMLHISVGTMDHDKVMRTIELLGTDVRDLISVADS
jgi:probable LLM family oxidoreductase